MSTLVGVEVRTLHLHAGTSRLSLCGHRGEVVRPIVAQALDAAAIRDFKAGRAKVCEDCGAFNSKNRPGKRDTSKAELCHLVTDGLNGGLTLCTRPRLHRGDHADRDQHLRVELLAR